jgi:hypothetical protein
MAIAELLRAATDLIAKVTPLLSETISFDIPPFTLLAPRPEHTAAEILSWNEAIGGSDLEFAQAECARVGKDLASLTDTEREILGNMIQNRKVRFQDQPPIDPDIVVERHSNAAIG